MDGWKILEDIFFVLGRLAGTYKSPMKRKETDLKHTSMIMFQPLIFRGVLPPKH